MQWASLSAAGERALIIDVPGGSVDRLLHDADVATVLNDRFETVFLHPRARPALTARFGWPSISTLDGEGCVRSTLRSPATAADTIRSLNDGLVARAEGRRTALPPKTFAVDGLPTDGGTWTEPDPSAMLDFVDAERGAPAVLWEGKPRIWGNRSDAERLAGESPEATAFLAKLPAERDWPVGEGPVVECEL